MQKTTLVTRREEHSGDDADIFVVRHQCHGCLLQKTPTATAQEVKAMFQESHSGIRCCGKRRAVLDVVKSSSQGSETCEGWNNRRINH